MIVLITLPHDEEEGAKAETLSVDKKEGTGTGKWDGRLKKGKEPIEQPGRVGVLHIGRPLF
jgi:hypothetical protein